MIQVQTNFRLPRSARIIRSDDFGRILRSKEPGSIRLGRDSVSVCVSTHFDAGHVRFGFTVGKHNVPRSVDRVLVKRIMRECARQVRSQLAAKCASYGIGADVSLRLRAPLKDVGRSISVDSAKLQVRQATQSCLSAVFKRLDCAAGEVLGCQQKSSSV